MFSKYWFYWPWLKHFHASFILIDNKYFIVLKPSNEEDCIRIFTFNGGTIQKIGCYLPTTFIDVFYEEPNKYNTYIITGHYGCVKSFKLNNVEYNNYLDDHSLSDYSHPSGIIHKNEKISELIESCEDGIIRMWNFHTGLLLKKIALNNDPLENLLNGICLWNNDYLFIWIQNNFIKLIDITTNKVIKAFPGHKKVKTIKKIIHPHYGECLISMGDNKIKLWVNKN